MSTKSNYKLKPDLIVTRKEDPTGEDLVALKELNIDPVFAPDETANGLMECHHNPERMLKLVNILAEEPVESIGKGVSGKEVFRMLQDFFLPFGIRFQL